MPDTLSSSTEMYVRVEFRSPHVVVFRLWYWCPGDAEWTIFCSGTDQEQPSDSSHVSCIGPLPKGSRLAYLFLFAGNPKADFHAEVVVSQNGRASLQIPIDGTTDEKGVRCIEGEVALC